jgi:hypothetical protein
MTFDKFQQFLAILAESAYKENPSGELGRMVAKLAELNSPGTAGTTVYFLKN